MVGNRKPPVAGQLSRRRLRPASLAVAMSLVGVLLVGLTIGLAGSAFAAAAAGQQLVDGTPCTRTAKACVELDKEQAWLIKDGAVMRGPVPMTSGVKGMETPRATTRVTWKAEMFYSTEFPITEGPNKGKPSPMPHAVFFDNHGRAFHEGNLDNGSAGCIRLEAADAEAFFTYLRSGDEVQIH